MAREMTGATMRTRGLTPIWANTPGIVEDFLSSTFLLSPRPQIEPGQKSLLKNKLVIIKKKILTNFIIFGIMYLE